MAVYTSLKCETCGGNIVEKEEVDLFGREETVKVCLMCNRQPGPMVKKIEIYLCCLCPETIRNRYKLRAHLDKNHDSHRANRGEVLRYFKTEFV